MDFGEQAGQKERGGMRAEAVYVKGATYLLPSIDPVHDFAVASAFVHGEPLEAAERRGVEILQFEDGIIY